MNYNLDKIKKYLLTFFLLVSSLFALFESYFSTLINLPGNWYISAIFIALIFIVEAIYDINTLKDNIDKVLVKSGWKRVKVFPSYEHFYDDLAKSLDSATSSLYLTHIRDQSPEDFDAESTRNYFSKLEKWCKKNPSGQIKRITTLSNSKMVDWGKELHKKTSSISNFYVRTCNWELSFPFINLAIIDNDEVYIALTTDTAQETIGIRINDKEISQAFISYFNNMWVSSIELENSDILKHD